MAKDMLRTKEEQELWHAVCSDELWKHFERNARIASSTIRRLNITTGESLITSN